jgi:hypothetical protein
MKNDARRSRAMILTGRRRIEGDIAFAPGFRLAGHL